MNRPRASSDEEVSHQLSNLEGWSLNGKKIKKEFLFKDFQQSFSFMAAMALKAEKNGSPP